MFFEQEDYIQEVLAQQEETIERDVCRDFKKGDCRRGERCIYYHPKLDVCSNFQYRECTKENCRFAHVTREEEETYRNSGVLPARMNNAQTQVENDSGHNAVLGKRNYNTMSGVSPTPVPCSKQNVPMQSSKQNVPVPCSKQNVPMQSSKQNVPMQNIQQNGSPIPTSHNRQNGSPRPMSNGQQSMLPRICRDFEDGDCRRGSRCKFYHPKLIICRDFQRQKCARENCRFLHATPEEEAAYDSSGLVPDHIDREKLRKSRVMNTPNNGADGTGEMRGNPRQDHSGSSNSAFAAVLQENEGLKSKLAEMQQQIMDLRKMNDTLYEQNKNFRIALAQK